jgi:thioredoxin 1
MPLTKVTSIGEFSYLLKNSGSKYVLIKHGSTWCRPCIMMKPIFQKRSNIEMYQNKIIFAEADYEDIDDELAKYCEITSLPTFHTYYQCMKVAEFKGANKEKLDSLLSAIMNAN